VSRYSFVGLIKIEFPTRTVTLCEGGFFSWGGDSYTSADAVFGTIEAVGELEEGVGVTLPDFNLTFLPAQSATPGDLSQPGFQNAHARFWMAQYDPDSGAITGTPELEFTGFVDLTTLVVGKATRKLVSRIVPLTERLLQRNSGNSLNPSFHKSVWPGETGEDQATGLGRSVAWGIEAPPSANSGAGGGGFSGGGTWWTGAAVKNL
jgi:hypothetical protein